MPRIKIAILALALSAPMLAFSQDKPAAAPEPAQAAAAPAPMKAPTQEDMLVLELKGLLQQKQSLSLAMQNLKEFRDYLSTDQAISDVRGQLQQLRTGAAQPARTTPSVRKMPEVPAAAKVAPKSATSKEPFTGKPAAPPTIPAPAEPKE